MRTGVLLAACATAATYSPIPLLRSSSLTSWPVGPAKLPARRPHGAITGITATIQREVTHAQVVSSEKTARLSETKNALLKLGLTSCRGERASTDDLVKLQKLVTDLIENSRGDDMKAGSVEGEWDLVMCDTQLFRSSPFFMAARAVVPDGSQADQFNWFCDQHRAALDFTQIGRVRQLVSNGQLRSEFEVKVGLAPLAFGLPVSVSGAIVTTADIVSSVKDTVGDVDGWRLAIKSVQVEGSNIPLLKLALDTWLQLPIPQITSALETTPISVDTWRPTPVFRTRYVDDTMRVSTDQDGNTFVYLRSS